MLVSRLVAALAVLCTCVDVKSPSECRSNSEPKVGYNDTFVPCDLQGTQSCFQLVIPSTKKRPNARIYGCMDDSKTPKKYWATKFKKGFYKSRYQISLEEKHYIGAIKLCAVNRCNELDMVVIEPLKQRTDRFPLRHVEYPILLIIALAFVSIYPVITSYSSSKKLRRQEFADVGKPIDPLKFPNSTFASSQDELVPEKVSGRLQTIAQVSGIIHKLQYPSTFDQFKSQLLRDKERISTPVSISEAVRTFEKDKTGYVLPLRSLPSKHEPLLNRLLEHGPGLFMFNPLELGHLFDRAADIFAEEPTLLEVPAGVVIYGDLKGQYPDLHRWFHIHGYPPNKRRHVFLGGILNTANDFSVETIALIIALKVALPRDVFVLRGAAEALTFNVRRRFPNKICRALVAVISRMCSHMPLAVKIGRKILAMHGGPSPLLQDLDDIPQIPRPIADFERKRISSHLLFSDPSHEIDSFEAKKHSRGVRFSAKAVEESCAKLGVHLIVRARNPVPGGYFMMANKKLLSLFSAPGYGGCVKGATAIVDEDMRVTIVRLAQVGNLKAATVGDSLTTCERSVELLTQEEPIQMHSSTAETTPEKNTAEKTCVWQLPLISQISPHFALLSLYACSVQTTKVVCVHRLHAASSGSFVIVNCSVTMPVDDDFCRSSGIIETADGKIRGKTYFLPGLPEVSCFLGIPYGKPPVGELRFEKPVPAERWSGVLECSKFGPRAPQANFLADNLSQPPSSEDCLNLNVFVPSNDEMEIEDRESGGRPVLVFIHGGGFAFHSASDYGDKGMCSTICKKGLIVVTVQYRLGFFGFLSTGDDAAPGNYGLWDQTLALKWIQKNIAYFGGNPKNVTVSGQSAGGASSDFLSVSPASRDLFQKVLSMGGNALCHFAMDKADNVRTACLAFAKEMGFVEDTNIPLNQQNKDLVTFFRALPKEDLELGILGKPGFKINQKRLELVPVHDGDFFPKPLDELRRETAPKICMIGATEYEGMFFVTMQRLKSTVKYIDQAIRRGIGLSNEDDSEEFREIVRRIRRRYLREDEVNSPAKVEKAMIRVIGDSQISFSLPLYTQKMTSAGHEVWQYSFDYARSGRFGFGNLMPFEAATHCSELPYIFGKGPFYHFHPEEEDKIVIENFTSCIANFCRYGDPNGRDKSLWKPAQVNNPYRYFSIDMVCQMKEGYQDRTAQLWIDGAKDVKRIRSRNSAKSHI
uniref:SER_THR_PHOSPHATASE domain-containing protein n=1 Tax=Steinernema glaseri TaxID=37863 RepID=A0A1I7Y5L9_9BILA